MAQAHDRAMAVAFNIIGQIVNLNPAVFVTLENPVGMWRKHPLVQQLRQQPGWQQCGDQIFQGNCAISHPRAAAEARRAEAVVAKRLAQRFVLGAWSGRMY